jgi:hypothetical protein
MQTNDLLGVKMEVWLGSVVLRLKRYVITESRLPPATTRVPSPDIDAELGPIILSKTLAQFLSEI